MGALTEGKKWKNEDAEMMLWIAMTDLIQCPVLKQEACIAQLNAIKGMEESFAFMSDDSCGSESQRICMLFSNNDHTYSSTKPNANGFIPLENFSMDSLKSAAFPLLVRVEIDRVVNGKRIGSHSLILHFQSNDTFYPYESYVRKHTLAEWLTDKKYIQIQKEGPVAYFTELNKLLSADKQERTSAYSKLFRREVDGPATERPQLLIQVKVIPYSPSVALQNIQTLKTDVLKQIQAVKHAHPNEKLTSDEIKRQRRDIVKDKLFEEYPEQQPKIIKAFELYGKFQKEMDDLSRQFDESARLGYAS